MLPLNFLQRHWRELLFGFAMCFLSSFGQTFFISMFGGEIKTEFGISDGEFGTLYSAGTLLSAAVLIWSGRLVDRLRLRDMATLVLGGLALTSAAMGLLTGPVMLVAVIFGLRQFGQGLSSHTGVTAAARRFAAQRGRAVSLASLGNTAGEALFPLIIVALIAAIDWRSVWLMSAALLLIAIPLIRWLIGTGHGQPMDAAGRDGRRIATGHDHTVGEVLREPSLWFRAPAMLAPSFIYTGLIFHQIALVEAKGWSMTTWAGNYLVFALASFSAIVVSGPLIDRLSARRLLKYALIPLAASCLVLWSSDAGWVIPVFMILIGFNAGFVHVLLGALWAELYGVRHLGAIKALGQAAMVFSTGLAPAIMGLLLDSGIGFGAIALGCTAYCTVASVLVVAAPTPRKEDAHVVRPT